MNSVEFTSPPSLRVLRSSKGHENIINHRRALSARPLIYNNIIYLSRLIIRVHLYRGGPTLRLKCAYECQTTLFEKIKRSPRNNMLFDFPFDYNIFPAAARY